MQDDELNNNKKTPETAHESRTERTEQDLLRRTPKRGTKKNVLKYDDEPKTIRKKAAVEPRRGQRCRSPVLHLQDRTEACAPIVKRGSENVTGTMAATAAVAASFGQAQGAKDAKKTRSDSGEAIGREGGCPSCQRHRRRHRHRHRRRSPAQPVSLETDEAPVVPDHQPSTSTLPSTPATTCRPGFCRDKTFSFLSVFSHLAMWIRSGKNT